MTNKKGDMMASKGKTKASLARIAGDETSETFEATFEGHKNDNPYDLWVTLEGSDTEGILRSRSNVAIRWNELNPVPSGTKCQVVVPRNVDPAHPITSYKAFVAEFPDVWTAVSNTVEFAA